MAKPLRLGARLRYPITISRLLKNPGDQVEKQEPILQYTFKYERTVGDPELGDERVNIETGIADFDSPEGIQLAKEAIASLVRISVMFVAMAS